jgi:aryl-alcohol dehydrogenase-like predicted oxidoreductase
VIPGFATANGTAAYRARMAGRTADGHFRSFRGLAVSSVGIGTYLGEEDGPTDQAYREAVALALRQGLNVVDSAINYRHQRSERSIGSALQALIQAGELAREEVILASKGGFIPFDGEAPPNASHYLTETYLRPGILAPEDVVAGCHCVTPRYLADQLERSRANLGVDTVDVYYVHNPEMQLSAVDRPTFLRRMREAFEFLESAVTADKIRLYGTATWNGYRQPPGAPDFLSLAELESAATEAAGTGHHFRVIQLPYNLAMPEAFTRFNQPLGRDTVSVLEAARRLEIYTMTSASIYQGQLARGLPPVIEQFLPGLATDAQRSLQFVRSTPGVGTALVGMKRAPHVEENARLAAVPPVPWEEFRKLFQEA